MTVEENKRVARRFYEEVVGHGSLDVVNDLIAEDYVEHEPELVGLGAASGRTP